MREELLPDLPSPTSVPPPPARVPAPRRLRRARTSIPELDAEGSGERVALGATPSVLVVEADPDEQWRLARALIETGVRVVGTSSGEGALALLSEWNVDLVLVAEELPGIDGFEVCKRILAQRASAQVLMMGALASKAERAGARGCIARPVDLGSVSLHLAQARALR